MKRDAKRKMVGLLKKNKQKNRQGRVFFYLTALCLFFLGVVIYFLSYADAFSVIYGNSSLEEKIKKVIPRRVLMTPTEKALYDEKLDFLAHTATTTACGEFCRTATTTTLTATTSVKISATTTVLTNESFAKTEPLWPVKSVYPNVGAVLPFKRVVAYYGNFYSKQMGVLGEYAEPEMLDKLKQEVAVWEAADPETPVVPAIHYIAVVAQGGPGADGKYRLRMPDDQIEKAINLAKQIDGLVFLDVQVGLSDLESEIPLLEKYLQLPQVHLAIDPEFSMRTSGKRPGAVIGTFDALDVNYAAGYLAKLVREKELPPKILVVHRFTEKMVTNYKEIKPLPEAQIVMDMDGWGVRAQKKRTYHDFIYSQPVQFTGLKLFYKNDLSREPKVMMTPKEILKLTPSPVYIQYQ